MNENHNPLAPQDISYVYNGYSPISVKLIDLIFEAGGVGNLIAQKKNHLGLLGLTADKIYKQENEARLFSSETNSVGGSRP